MMPALSNLARRLLENLRQHAALLRGHSEDLEEMSRSLALGKEAQLEAVLQRMEAHVLPQQSADRETKGLRDELALALGVTLPRLEDVLKALPPSEAAELALQRQELRRLAGQVRRQQLSAARVLEDSAAFTGMLLDLLCPGRETLTTYGPRTVEDWRGGAGLLRAEM